MQSLRSLLTDAETDPILPAGDEERFSGYAVMSVPFESGHLLGLRRFPLTSIGPGYTSVWLRDPEGSWVIYTTIDPALSCPRYFGAAVSATSIHDIDVSWTGDQSFTVTIGDDVDLSWRLQISATPMTRLMSGAMAMVPHPAWHNTRFLSAMGAVAGPALRAGRMGLTGVTPNRQWFRAGPKQIWAVDESTASLAGTDLGRIAAPSPQSRLGDFWMPQRGILMLGSASFSPFDPDRHYGGTTAAA
ncbi:hypothetical protein D9V29_04120 [Mycetocola manganoxydans]|uniref:DUF2071 domain-containing protein n=1 Tax=Mycetocola manganoxydans TaxID=699879 RepID=A0A3L6ZXV4_9MICO|nr:hypothetical protein [Mycetocola manganoxydans]RLP72600.1 hypothetical protein D9V29_04120 [Mycetocola manganoxydans]GHD40830.1 hypothetical protein GCM10008097_05360 [Mycetocola manganoxydans]